MGDRSRDIYRFPLSPSGASGKGRRLGLRLLPLFLRFLGTPLVAARLPNGKRHGVRLAYRGQSGTITAVVNALAKLGLS